MWCGSSIQNISSFLYFKDFLFTNDFEQFDCNAP